MYFARGISDLSFDSSCLFPFQSDPPAAAGPRSSILRTDEVTG